MIRKTAPFHFKIALTTLFIAISFQAFGQEEPPRKSPVEIASAQAERLERDLKLNHYQSFLVDSTLQTNLVGVSVEFEQMRRAGMQNQDNYREVQKKWQKATEEAFEKIMTLDQFDRFLKISGVSNRERRKRIAELKAKGKK